MKIKVHRCDGTIPGTETILCDRFVYREAGFMILTTNGEEVAVFGPGFKGFVEIERESYDRGS